MARARYLPNQLVTFEVKRNRGIRTIEGYLASRLYINDIRAKALIVQGSVKVDGKELELSSIIDLKAGSIVEITFPNSWPPYMQPTEMDLDIIYEDDELIALNKPAGRVVHPSSGHLTGETLQNGILHRYKDSNYHDKMISPAHRLDRYTTGVIVYSRTQSAYKELTGYFRENQTHKNYLAITDGLADWAEIEVNAPLGIDPENRTLRRVPPNDAREGSKEAITKFRVIESGNNWSLIEAIPITGRSHQIRAHLKHLGLPILCDHEYNPDGRKLKSLSFQALHARELKIKHPRTQKLLTLQAELPLAFANALLELKNAENNE